MAEGEAAITLALFAHVCARVAYLEIAHQLNSADQREIQARILRLRGREEENRAIQALSMIREDIGPGATIEISNSRCQEIEREADGLIESAAALRREAAERKNRIEGKGGD